MLPNQLSSLLGSFTMPEFCSGIRKFSLGEIGAGALVCRCRLGG